MGMSPDCTRPAHGFRRRHFRGTRSVWRARSAEQMLGKRPRRKRFRKPSVGPQKLVVARAAGKSAMLAAAAGGLAQRAVLGVSMRKSAFVARGLDNRGQGPM